jgi:hypothetical protein
MLRSYYVLKAKLGQQNKFYYDEKLKQWVEEGAEIPAEEPPLPPPPTKSSSYQNGMPDYNLNGPASGIHTTNGVAERRSPKHSDHGLGMPPIPPSQNQFSARGRMGVRSRYFSTDDICFWYFLEFCSQQDNLSIFSFFIDMWTHSIRLVQPEQPSLTTNRLLHL